jgi:hypothetical protein
VGGERVESGGQIDDRAVAGTEGLVGISVQLCPSGKVA